MHHQTVTFLFLNQSASTSYLRLFELLVENSSAWTSVKCSSLKTVWYLSSLFNASLAVGVFHDAFKSSYTIIWLRSGLYIFTPVNYRPVSNLSMLSKLLKRTVSNHMVDYLDCNKQLHQHQSARWKDHSFETAFTKVMADLITTMNKEVQGLLALLDVGSN